MSKYLIDTQLYVRAIRNRAEYEKLWAFTSAYSPSVYVCSVVPQELFAGSYPDGKLELLLT